MQRHAITFRVKAESVDAVRELLANYEPPEWTAPDGTRLLGTSIFLKGDTVVRVMDIEGSLPSVMAHLAQQPSIQALERALDPHLAEPRDLSTPEGARAFFGAAMMEHVTTRVATFAAVDR
ncbi:SchA/CurD-like domain-containing protein [Cryptosporangium minutisporangium]|uniref:SchA/CurD-like domain-containing protein n=1 Tax=Cryptosporangium minutisporangium TaxID=113569 RepID=A0ABP6SS68_9ACTN